MPESKHYRQGGTSDNRQLVAGFSPVPGLRGRLGSFRQTHIDVKEQNKAPPKGAIKFGFSKVKGQGSIRPRTRSIFLYLAAP